MKALLWLCSLSFAWSFTLPKEPSEYCPPRFNPQAYVGIALRLIQDIAKIGVNRRPKCAPLQWNVGARSLPETFTGNYSLHKRVMTLPVVGATPDALSDFMVQEVAAARKVIHDDTVSTASYKRFGRKPTSFGISELSGCTTLVVVSRTGAYIGHYFENLSFDPDPDVPYGGDPEAAFQNTVLNGLEFGIKRRNKIDQDSLKAHAHNLQGGRAFLIVPVNGPDDQQMPYQNMWNRMQRSVQAMVPGVSFQVVTYVALNRGDPLLESSYRGRFLFKHDAAHQSNDPRQLVKIWHEATEIYTDAW